MTLTYPSYGAAALLTVTALFFVPPTVSAQVVGVDVGGGGALISSVGEPQLFPVPVTKASLTGTPFRSMGYIETQFTDFVAFRGSAVIARHPQLIYTAAHVTYNDGVWTSEFRFKRAWHGVDGPRDTQMIPVRGYRHYANYSQTIFNRPSEFAKDFAVGYRTNRKKFGPALPVSSNAGSELANDALAKSIHGYPAELSFDFSSGQFLQHQTGPFLGSFQKESGPYRFLEGVTTGPGNSGGGVVNLSNGRLALSGILVSGSRTGAGVYGLNNTAETIAKNALVGAGVSVSGVKKPRVTKTFKNTKTLILPNGSSRYQRRDIMVRGMPKTLVVAKFSLDIASDLNDDLDLYLRSPRGRIRWIQKNELRGSLPFTTTDFDHLIFSKEDYSSTYAGQNPNGKWTLFMRDFWAVDYSAFRSAHLQIGSR